MFIIIKNFISHGTQLFRFLPNETMSFKGEKWINGKLSKKKINFIIMLQFERLKKKKTINHRS